jgi:hypothetical protein
VAQPTWLCALKRRLVNPRNQLSTDLILSPVLSPCFTSIDILPDGRDYRARVTSVPQLLAANGGSHEVQSSEVLGRSGPRRMLHLSPVGARQSRSHRLASSEHPESSVGFGAYRKDHLLAPAFALISSRKHSHGTQHRSSRGRRQKTTTASPEEQ